MNGPMKYWVPVVVVAGLAAIVWFIVTAEHTAPSNPQSAAPDASAVILASQAVTRVLDEPTPATPYASSADGFTVDFAKAPRVDSTKFDSLVAGIIPLTRYHESFQGEGRVAYYQVSVYHFPESYQFPSDYLTEAMQVALATANQAYPGSVIADQKDARFLGSPAIMGLITVPVPQATGTSPVITGAYVLVTVKGQNAYALSVYGMDQANFRAFIESFSFTK